MRFRPHAIGVAMLVAVATVPTPASAQSGDPDQGSPSGVIYEIPLDNARRDAAPSGGGGGGSSTNGGGTSNSEGGGTATNTTGAGTVSPIRSENGFGSSSTVPGVAAAVIAGKGNKGGGNRGGDGSGSGSDGAQAPAQTSPAEALGDPKTATINPSPSKSRAYLLLGLALAVAAGIGLAGRYITRQR